LDAEEDKSISVSRSMFFDVFATQSVEIPPSSECIVQMKICDCEFLNEGVFCPNKDKLSKLGILGASSISKCTNGCIPVRLINVNNSKVTLNKDTKVGRFETLENCKTQINSINFDNNKEEIQKLAHNIDKNTSLNNYL